MTFYFGIAPFFFFFFWEGLRRGNPKGSPLHTFVVVDTNKAEKLAVEHVEFLN